MSDDLLTRVADKLRADAQFGYGNPDMQLIRDLAARVRELEAERDALRHDLDRLMERELGHVQEIELLRQLLHEARHFAFLAHPDNELVPRIDAALKESP